MLCVLPWVIEMLPKPLMLTGISICKQLLLGPKEGGDLYQLPLLPWRPLLSTSCRVCHVPLRKGLMSSSAWKLRKEVSQAGTISRDNTPLTRNNSKWGAASVRKRCMWKPEHPFVSKAIFCQIVFARLLQKRAVHSPASSHERMKGSPFSKSLAD